jgi:hypothetical protein
MTIILIFRYGLLDRSQAVLFVGRRSEIFGNGTTTNLFYLMLGMIFVESVSFWPTPFDIENLGLVVGSPMLLRVMPMQVAMKMTD